MLLVSKNVVGELNMAVQTVNYTETIEHLSADSTLVVNDVPWEEYEELLIDVGEAKGLRISYDSGRLQIMTLSTTHEKYQYLISGIVSLLSLRLRIKVLCFGSATMKKKPRGVEPDLSFYVQTAALIGSRSDLDFSIDPPPDIVVEVDLQHQSLSKFPIYASFGVPELWRYDGKSMTIYHLEHGEYLATDSSRALPMLSSDILTEFLARVKKEDQYETLLAFEQWLSLQNRER